MASKYDLESLLADVQSIVSTHFGAKVTAINAEKADAIVLDDIPAGAYFLQQLNGKMANYNPICLYGVDNIETISRGPLSSQKVVMSVIVIVEDTGEEVECGIRMFRYQRVLSEIFKENWNEGRHGVKLEIRSLVPIPLTDLNATNRYRAVGVELEGNLG